MVGGGGVEGGGVEGGGVEGGGGARNHFTSHREDDGSHSQSGPVLALIWSTFGPDPNTDSALIQLRSGSDLALMWSRSVSEPAAAI